MGEKQCSEFGRSESNYERFHGSSEDDSDEEYFHKSPALALSLYDCVLYKYFDAMFFRVGHVTCSDHTTLDGGALRHAPLRRLDLESLCPGRSDQSDWLYQVRPRNFRSFRLLFLAYSASLGCIRGSPIYFKHEIGER